MSGKRQEWKHHTKAYIESIKHELSATGAYGCASRTLLYSKFRFKCICLILCFNLAISLCISVSIIHLSNFVASETSWILLIVMLDGVKLLMCLAASGNLGCFCQVLLHCFKFHHVGICIYILTMLVRSIHRLCWWLISVFESVDHLQ